MTAYTFDKVKTIADDLPSGTITVLGQFELTAALAEDDVLSGIPIPKNAYITGVTIETDELDTGGSATLTLNVGDSTDEDRFVVGAINSAAFNSTSINVNGISAGLVTAGTGYRYTADDSIIVTVLADPETGATSGLLMVKVEYTMDAF